MITRLTKQLNTRQANAWGTNTLLDNPGIDIANSEKGIAS